MGLENISVKQISCGSWHSAAIADKGLLYCWGCGEDGQLGNGSDTSFDEDNQCLPRIVRGLLSKECQFVACGAQHTMAITENTRYKKPVDEAVLDAQFAADEERRRIMLKKCARATVQARRKQSSVDIVEIQRRVSESAGDFMAKSLAKARTSMACESTGTWEKKEPVAAQRPSTARSDTSKRRGARPLSARSDVSNYTVGYASQRYRSELRQTLRDIGLYHSQGPQWGQPAHFVPMPPSDDPRPPSEQSYSTRQTKRLRDQVSRLSQSSSGGCKGHRALHSSQSSPRGACANESRAERALSWRRRQNRPETARPSTDTLKKPATPKSARPSTALPAAERGKTGFPEAPFFFRELGRSSAPPGK